MPGRRCGSACVPRYSRWSTIVPLTGAFRQSLVPVYVPLIVVFVTFAVPVRLAVQLGSPEKPPAGTTPVKANVR